MSESRRIDSAGWARMPDEEIEAYINGIYHSGHLSDISRVLLELHRETVELRKKVAKLTKASWAQSELPSSSEGWTMSEITEEGEDDEV